MKGQNQFLDGGGQVGELMRSHDWSASVLGRPDGWPPPLRTIVDLLLQSRFPMFVAWGADLGFLYNDAYAQILGAKHPAALGRRFADIWSEIWPDISPLIDAAMNGRATYREDLPLVLNRKGFDEQTWFTFSYSPVRDENGSVAGMFCAVSETTAKVMAERRLRESEGRLRALVTASSYALYRMSPDWSQMLSLDGQGFVQDTTSPSGAWIIDDIHPDDHAHVMAGIREGIAERRTFELEHRVRRADGTIGWTLSRAVPLLDASGNITEWFGAASDVTGRKNAEEALRASEERLREADRRKDEFLAMLAHELRNPLAPIRTGLELIRIAGNTPEAVERVRSVMDRQVAHMVRLVDDLLDVSRITSGKIELQREPTPLDTLVNSAIETNRAAMTAKQIRLTVSLPEAPCALDVDPTRFVQVISNLLNNATKFTNAGGAIEVTAHVNTTAEDDGGPARELVLSVADSGIGIPAEFQPHIFDWFTQGAGGSSEPGLGIGLALARRLMEMHGGQIEVRSHGAGHGSEFLIRLPLSAQAPSDQAADPIGVPDVDCRVLVIDDNHDAATVMAMLVEEVGAECRTAHDGTGGLREMRDFRPHLVLLDIGMPGMDGYETCRRIRRDFGDEMVVVALTGFGQEEDKERAARAGFSAHLTKPADPAVLASLLRQCSAGRVVRQREAGPLT
jgi:signal transduction histidine kinase/ActR/RegA family two-component response regulator